MRPVLTVVGSGTLVPSGERSSPCHLVEAEDTVLLLDAGPGAVHGLARLGKPWWKVTHVVLTHYHTDHFGDLPHLLFALKWGSPGPRHRPLQVLGPPGLEGRVEALRRAFGDFVTDPGFEVAYHEVGRNGSRDEPAPGAPSLRFLPVPHTAASVAVRVTLGGRSLGYTGDTGPEPTLGSFFRGVDVLISECGYADPPASASHLSPASVAAMARSAEPGVLVLTHLYPPLDCVSAPRLVREAGYRGEVVCARDGERFVLGPAGGRSE
ncbi:MAG: MBL fold metallo-hydrolase [Gemmatimonadota bacterium]|nr:MBL fold metallo-hydrolase [Gemmatimonadota bacterium]MDE2871285.1 MBL fold metallo-hydrolase [Gemmatimonadota bacterium]